MFEVLLFGLISCLILFAFVYGMYKSMTYSTDYEALVPMLFVCCVCGLLMYCNLCIFFPAQVEEFQLRQEAEKFILENQKHQAKIKEQKIKIGGVDDEYTPTV